MITGQQAMTTMQSNSANLHDSNNTQDNITLDYQSVRQRIFTTDTLEQLQEYAEQVSLGMISQGLDPDNDIRTNITGDVPANFNVLTFPVKKQNEYLTNTPQGQKLTKRVENSTFVIAQVPSVDLLLTHTEARAWLEAQVNNFFASKISNTLKSKSPSIPATIEAFITQASRQDPLTSYKQVAKIVLPVISKKIPDITSETLQNCLASKSYAETVYRGITQNVWELIINMFITSANTYITIDKLGNKQTTPLDTSIFTHWLNTREDAQGVADITLDGDDFADLLA